MPYREVTTWLWVPSIVALVGCPQLLDDSFETVPQSLGRGGGSWSCIGPGCSDSDILDAGSGGTTGGSSGAQGGSAQGGSAQGGSAQGGSAQGGSAQGGSAQGGSAQGGSAQGGSGQGGAALGGSAGSGGASGAGTGGTDSGGSGGSGGSGTTEPPACWTITLTDKNHDSSQNCLGVHGWNDVEADPGNSSASVTYQNGRVCISADIAATGWGAVYNLTFAHTDGWNAEALGVGGIELEFVGPKIPDELLVTYTDADGDWCRTLSPVVTSTFRFDDYYPGCKTGSPDPSELEFLRLAIHPSGQSYEVDFCVGLRAVP